MRNFEESGIVFQYDPQNTWIVKYDDHRYYKWIKGRGLKGVDFLILQKNGPLYLLEVKNYKQSKNHPVEVFPDNLADHLLSKQKDTIKGIKVAAKVIQRKWWYIFFKEFSTWSYLTDHLRPDWMFWLLADSYTLKKNVYLVWIEWEGGSDSWNKLSTQLQSSSIETILLNSKLFEKDMNLPIKSVDSSQGDR